jgi:hypothetical protein
MYVARPKIKKYAGQIISYMKQREENKIMRWPWNYITYML